MMIRLLTVMGFLVFVTGCAPALQTKQAAYPAMYSETKPASILIVPAINETTAANAGDYLNVTVSQPFANQGYYVLPVPIVADIFNTEGIVDGSQLKGIPMSVYRNNFGADAVLFITIEDWSTNYSVIAGSVTVAIEYVLVSTATNEPIWADEKLVTVDTSGGAAGSPIGLLVSIVETAVKTAAQDYIPVAQIVHNRAMIGMPYGDRHPQSGTDAESAVVNIAGRDGALEAF